MIPRVFTFSFLVLIIFNSCLSGCTDDKLVIRPQPVDLSVDAIGGNVVVTGNSLLQQQGHFIWGASVLKGEDGHYHMLFSTWQGSPEAPVFTQSWVLNSTIGYAVSSHPDRDFQIKGIVLKGRRHEGDTAAWDAQSVHNPHLRKFGDSYYLYYTGSKDPGPQAKGSSGENLSKRDRVQQYQRIGVIRFSNFEDLLAGKYVRSEQPLLIPRTRVKPDNIVEPSPEGIIAGPDNIIVVNPSVVYRPSDKKYLLYFKGNLYDPSWRGVHGVAISDTPEGPFQPMDDFALDVRLEGGEIANSEDPYVWYHNGDQLFYAVVKDFTGRITGSKAGLALLVSGDGERWVRHEQPLFMKKELLLERGGSALVVNRLERPQLLLDEHDRPIVLYAACSVDPCNDKRDGGTFNVHIPIKVSPSFLR